VGGWRVGAEQWEASSHNMMEVGCCVAILAG
jgi:hypothetical protein